MIQLVRRGGAVCLLVGMLVVAGLPGLRGADSRAAFAASAAQSGPARVRFVNATPDAAPLDVYVDAALYVGGLTAASGYMDADPGHHTIHVRHSGGSTDAATAQVTLAGDQRVTVATSVNESGSVEIQVIEDDVSAPARNAVRIKVVHVAPGIGPVTVTVSGQTLASGLVYGKVSGAVQIITGAYDLTVTNERGTKLIEQGAEPFTGNRSVTIFIVGVGQGDFTQVRLVCVASSVLAPTGVSRFQFTHMARRTGPLAVYINGENVYPEVGFTTVTPYYAAPPGPYRIDVYPVGAGPAGSGGSPLASGEIEIAPDQHVVFAARENNGTVQLSAYPADLGPVPPGSARLLAIHLAAGNPAIRVTQQPPGVVLFDTVAAGATASRTVPGGLYDIQITDAATGDILMDKPGVEVRPGSLTLLIVFDTDPAAPRIGAYAVPAGDVPVYALVRWVHAEPDGTPLDLYLDGVPIFTGMDTGAITGYGLLLPGRYALTAYPAGSNPARTDPLASHPLNLGGGTAAQTVLFFRAEDGLRFRPQVDSLDLIPAGSARVRFINAAWSAGPITIRPSAAGMGDGESWSDTLFTGEASVNRLLGVGAWTFQFERNGAVVATAGPLDLQSGTAYTVVLVDDSGSALDTLVLEAQP